MKKMKRLLSAVLILSALAVLALPAHAAGLMRYGSRGAEVKQLQGNLIYLGYLDAGHLSGHFGNATLDALRAFQTSEGQRASGIANIQTQLRLDEAVDAKYNSDPATWTVVDEE